jgi:hypothetical protein
MSDEFLIGNLNPVHPCICGHLITAHGEEGGSYYGGWDMNSEGNEVWREEQEQPQPVCYECGPNFCVFVEMDNLEFLEWKSETKSNDNN